MRSEVQIEAKFRELFASSPTMFSSPGRINLIGEHTDYNDGLVLPAAIDKEMALAISVKKDGPCIVYSYDYEHQISFNLENFSANSTPWLNYILGVVAQIQKKGMSIRPFDCVFGGNIPLGAGLSSSAALECVFIYALNELNSLGLDKLEMVKMAQKAEHEYAGVNCGIMDQFASMFGEKDHVIQLDCRSLEYRSFPFVLDDYDVVLCDTNVKHSLASSEYNLRRQECERGVAMLQKYQPDIKSLRDVSIELLEAHKNEIDEVSYRRCRYVIEEIQRVKDSCLMLENGDMDTFGKNMFATHEGLSKEYEVSCDELDFFS